jgi:hypothetical protein
MILAVVITNAPTKEGTNVLGRSAYFNFEITIMVTIEMVEFQQLGNL